MGVPPAGMGWLDVPRDFLRQRPVDGGPRVMLGASLWHQVPVAWLSLARTEAEVPYLPQHELAGCNCEAGDTSIGVGAPIAGKPGGGPTVSDTRLMEVLAVVIIEDAIEA